VARPDRLTVAALGDGGADGGLFKASLLGGGQQHARKAGLQRESRHLQAEAGYMIFVVDRAEIVQQALGAFQGLLWRHLNSFDVQSRLAGGHPCREHCLA